MDYTNLKEKMEKVINTYNERLSEIRAGRSNKIIISRINRRKKKRNSKRCKENG